MPALDDKHRALIEYVDKVTLRPSECRREDLDHLRSEGATDEEIHNCVQVAAYFNYINRVADGLGVDLEASMRDGAPSHLA